MKQPEFCSFDGCIGKAKSKGYCDAHLRQLRLNGRMVPIRTIVDECTYAGAHHRCRALWGRAPQYPCVSCGDPAEEWAYDGTDPSELYDDRIVFNRIKTVLPYSMFPEFYMPMCKSCHKNRDMAYLAAELTEFREWRKARQSKLVDDPPF